MKMHLIVCRGSEFIVRYAITEFSVEMGLISGIYGMALVCKMSLSMQQFYCI